MNKRSKMIAGLVVLALLAGGGFMVLNGDKKDTDQSDAQTSQDKNGAFKAYTGSYSATIASIANGKATSSITIAVKDADTYSVTTGGDEGGGGNFILDGTDFYIQGSNNEWIKYPSSQSTYTAPSLSAFTGYLQSADALARYTGAKVKGDANCSIGKCKLYEYTSPGSDDKVSIFVDKSNGRIIEILTKLVNGDETKITYDYSAAVDVQVPQNAKTMSVPAP